MLRSINDLRKVLTQAHYKPYGLDSTTVYIAVKYNKKQEVFDKLRSLFSLESVEITNKKTYSGEGHVVINKKYNIVVVPDKLSKVDAQRIRRYTAKETKQSLKNEIFLEKAISQVVWDTMRALTVIFVAAGKRVIVKNINGTKTVGRNTSNRKKADVLLQTGNTLIPVSIKQDNAGFWESAETYWGDNAGKMLMVAQQEQLLDAEVNNGNMKLNKPVGTQANRQEEKDVIFGSDLAQNGLIVRRTFRDTDFQYDGRNHILTVKCSRIIVRQADVKQDEKAWFVVRNKANATSHRIGFKGVVVDAVPYKSVTNTTQRVKRQKIR